MLGCEREGAHYTTPREHRKSPKSHGTICEESSGDNCYLLGMEEGEFNRVILVYRKDSYIYLMELDIYCFSHGVAVSSQA